MKNKKQAPKKAATRSMITVGIVLSLVLGGLGWAVLGGQKQAPRPERRPHAHTAAPTVNAREVYTRMLEHVRVADDARGARIWEFYQSRSLFSRIVSGGTILSMEDKITPSGGLLPIVPATREERLANGGHVLELWQFSSLPTNMLFVPPPGWFTDIWGGAVFAHEISHAFDVMTGVEPPGLPNRDPRFLDGEIRAYQMEYRLLDRQVNGQLSAAIVAELERSRDRVGPTGWFMPGRETEQRLDTLFPAARSEDEGNNRRGAYIVFLNFLLVDQRGLGQEGRRQFIISLSGY